MKVLINIPKEFEQHFQADRFEDSLHRLRADVYLLAGKYEQEIVQMLAESFSSALPVPPHGRLGDLDALAELVTTPGIFPPVVSSEVFAFLRNAPTIIPPDHICEGVKMAGLPKEG